jgi:flagellin
VKKFVHPCASGHAPALSFRARRHCQQTRIYSRIHTGGNCSSAVAAIDKAISDTSNLSSLLGADQTNALQANANNLTTTLANTTSAQSVAQDTDFAAQIANFTRLQAPLQAGSTVLSNANQTTQLLAKLLAG